MHENGTTAAEHLQSSDAVRLLWEGTQTALTGGLDHDDLISLCEIVVRVADHRLLMHQVQGGGEEVVEQLRQYRDRAAEVLQWAMTPAPEPDWSAVAERLASAGAAPLE